VALTALASLGFVVSLLGSSGWMRLAALPPPRSTQPAAAQLAAPHALPPPALRAFFLRADPSAYTNQPTQLLQSPALLTVPAGTRLALDLRLK
jgi:hypothetical protein